ncbi:MAG: CRISPR-associated ring nuclease [Anaerolineae bacterium]
MRESVFISTLGSEPQVVTLALYLLRLQGVECSRSVVIHTDDSVPAIAQALDDLRKEFQHHRWQGIRLELRPIMSQERYPVRDISTEADARATFRTIFQVVQEEKRAGREIHFSIAGGRKVMSIYGMVVAQLLFDSSDRLYHLLSEGPLLRERRMVPWPEDKVRLVPVPVLRWQEGAHLLGEIMRYEDPLEAVRSQALKRQREYERLDQFVREKLSPAERQVCELVVREGLSNSDIAAKLALSPKTVANHLSSIYAKLRESLQIPPERTLGRYILIHTLSAYYQEQDGEIGKYS